MQTFSFPQPLVSADWLMAHLGQVRVVDCRWSLDQGPKRTEYLSGHIPGAVFADLDVDLSDPPGARGRHPLPSPERFCSVRGRLGLLGPVVTYDDAGGAIAARLWWMLRAIGVPCAVLDGGLQAWKGPLEEGDATAASTPSPPPGLSPSPWPASHFVPISEVTRSISERTPLLDARSGARFRGEPNPVDPVRGHIPGARSRPWQENLGADGRFLGESALASSFGDVDAVLASCGSGVTGCHILLAAAVVGIPGRLYVGSWSEWIWGGERAVEVG